MVRLVNSALHDSTGSSSPQSPTNSETNTNSERTKALTDIFELQFAPYPNFADITAKVDEEVYKGLFYPLKALFPEHGIRNIISDELQGYIVVKIW